MCLCVRHRSVGCRESIRFSADALEPAIITAMENNKQIRMLTTGMHVFPVLRRNEKAKYVDKTALLHTLCNDVDQQLLISRPRRFGKSPEEAIEQARTKDYAGPWLDGDPPVFLVGVNYDPAKRGIDDPLVEPVTV